MRRIIEVFIGGRYSNLSQNTKELVIFLSKLSNKLTLEIDINNYELSKEEYEQKLIKDMKDYYKEEDNNRRNNYRSDYKYSKQYTTEDELADYFDRLRNYDKIEMNNIIEELNKRIEKNTSYEKEISDVTINNKDSKLDKLFKNLLIDAKFSPISIAIMGSIYKTYFFNINSDLINYIIEKNNLFTNIRVGENLYLENPVFYFNDRIIMAVTTHEQSATLFLTQEELYEFNKLNIAHVL